MKFMSKIIDLVRRFPFGKNIINGFLLAVLGTSSFGFGKDSSGRERPYKTHRFGTTTTTLRYPHLIEALTKNWVILA